MDSTIAHYNLLERVGEGALGEVYRARDTKFGRTVALKLIPDAAFDDAANRAALLDDARAAASLSHPNIAILFDVGEYEGGCYLAYEFASGVSLRQEAGAGGVHPRRVVELGVQIADALADAHARGILHTDLRPETIVVTPKGNAKVLDFGMARWTRGGMIRARAVNDAESLGHDAVAIVSYMSPEQALGGPVDARTDVFSLAVILYEMLTGRNPFVAATAAQALLNVISVPAPSNGGTDLDAIVLRAMAKQIDKRHQSAASFSAELRSVGAILDVRSGDSQPGELLPLDDDGGSGVWWVVFAIALVVAVAAGWWYWGGR